MDDLISRQDAIDALQKEINKGIPPFDDVMGSIRCGVRLARNIIEDLPSAEPRCIANIHFSQEQLDEAFEKVKTDILSVKPKTGKWILHESPDIYHCSDCECPFCGWETVYDKNPELKWCACCGARLEE